MKKEFEKKLVLNKQTIARLNLEEMTTAHGGTGTILTPLTPLIEASIDYCELLIHGLLSIIENCLTLPDIHTQICTDRQTCYVQRVGCVVQR